MKNDPKDRWKEFNLIIDNEDLDIKEKGLLLILFRYVNYTDGYASPSRSKIKELSKISHDITLDKLFKSLIAKGYLERSSGKGAKTRSKYFIKIPINNIPIENGGRIPIKNIGRKEKEKKIKENIYSIFDSYTENKELRSALNDFAEMRKTIKKPLTNRAIVILLNKLDKLGTTDDEKKLVLEQSIFNNWQGIFELKENKRYAEKNKPEREISNFDY